MSKPRSLFYLGVLGGHIYAVCGWLGPNSVTKSVERYDVLTDSWNDAASVPLGLHEHAGLFCVLCLVCSGLFEKLVKPCTWLVP